MSRKLLAFILFVVIQCFWRASEVEALSVQDTSFALFEEICIRNIDASDEILNVVSMYGAKKLEDKLAIGLLAPQKGKAWYLKYNGKIYIITLTNHGVCTVIGDAKSIARSREILKDSYRAILLNKDDIGTNVLEMYSISYKNIKSGNEDERVVMLQSSKLSAETFSMSILPSNILESN